MKSKILLVVFGILVVFLLLITVVLFDFETVQGNQVGVKETWSQGVVAEPLHSKTYLLFPGFTQKVYKYDLSSQVFVMNDLAEEVEYGEGRKSDSYLVQSAEGQDMTISLNVRWRIDPVKIIEIHKTIRDNIEEKVLRPEIMRVVKDEATTRTAIEAYSGEGLVSLQADILDRLSDPAGELRNRGVIVENFVIEHIGLDPEYVGQIKARQVAIQSELRAREETKAALAEAERAKADAQAAYERAVVDAKRDKEVGILEGEKTAEQEVLKAQASAKQVQLAAEADKIKTVLAAEAERESGELKAQAILAIGQAEAEATRLKLSAYSAEGVDAFVQIEVARHMAAAFENISGYLPQDMKINLLSESFVDAIKQVTQPAAATRPANPGP